MMILGILIGVVLSFAFVAYCLYLIKKDLKIREKEEYECYKTADDYFNNLKLNKMKDYKIEYYSRKKPFRRRQYRWRIRHINSKKVATGGEGYNNYQDCKDSLHNLIEGLKRGNYTEYDVFT